MPSPLEALLCRKAYPVVIGLMNEMDHWTENKNHYLKNAAPRE